MDEEALAAFLVKAAALVEEELESVATSRAWAGFRGWGEQEEEEGEEVVLAGSAEQEGWMVSALCWSGGGGSLVCAVGQEHPEWCAHLPRLVVHRVDRSGGLVGGPEQSLPAPSCPSCLAPHPWDPVMLAVGCHSGEVLVYRY